MDIATRLHRLIAREHVSDRDLADMGLTRIDLHNLQSGVPGARQRIEAMAAQIGLSPKAIDADLGLAKDIAQACAQCGEARACARAIRKGVRLPEENCPNMRTYRGLAFVDAVCGSDA